MIDYDYDAAGCAEDAELADYSDELDRDDEPKLKPVHCPECGCIDGHVSGCPEA